MNKAEQFIQSRLQLRADNGSIRQLSSGNLPIDFCSNDYLGFARSDELKEATTKILDQQASYLNGATGSRLISGNTSFVEETESYIAGFHNAPSGLIFNSGYDANIGLISSLAQRGDTIISDEFIHASLIDGARLTHANRYTFRHNDLNDLQTKLKAAKGLIYVLTESVYSMDGDTAPLKEMLSLCEAYQAHLIVDEAHAVGIFGEQGKGLVQHLALEDRIFARIVTFGKAIGGHGAIILGSSALRDYLINFARSFIYTTAAPIHGIATVKAAYQMLTQMDHTVNIRSRIALYTDLVQDSALITTIATGPIQTIQYHNNTQAKSAAQQLQSKGLDIRAILSPTVPEGQERLRICLHSFNTDEQIKTLVSELEALKKYEQ
jgi:8-amino-7-oxononanoate synthase